MMKQKKVDHITIVLDVDQLKFIGLRVCLSFGLSGNADNAVTEEHSS